jgi:alanine dehydrogenase
MMKEQGEKRVFLPEFVHHMAESGLAVYIEEGYGSRSGFSFEDYRQAYENIFLCSRRVALNQDLVLILRSVTLEELNTMEAGRCLVSMLHFPTRSRRVEALKNQGIKAISLDSIVNGQNVRLVENMKAVAWNGLEAAFDVLERDCPNLIHPNGEPWRVLILGSGMVGKYAVDAAVKLGNIERNSESMQKGGMGAIAQVVGRNLSENVSVMEKLFRQTDILVDATQRRNPAIPVVPNAWLAWLPDHAVVTDLAVDPYALDSEPPVVRGIEGIPQGNLNKYIFFPDDPDWEDTVPQGILSNHRRRVVSCYSWPGIHPEACMRHYAHQLEPLMDALIRTGYDGLSLEGDYFERALFRATLSTWLASLQYRPTRRFL